jgi:hypothetical protein
LRSAPTSTGFVPAWEFIVTTTGLPVLVSTVFVNSQSGAVPIAARTSFNGLPQNTRPLPTPFSVTVLPSRFPQRCAATRLTASWPAEPSSRLGEYVGFGPTRTAPASTSSSSFAATFGVRYGSLARSTSTP